MEQLLPSRPFIKAHAESNEEMGTETVYRLSTNYDDGLMSRVQKDNNLGVFHQSAGSSRKLRSAGRDVVGASSEFDYEPRVDYPEPSPRYSLAGEQQKQQLQHSIRSRGDNRGAGNTYIDYSEYGL